MHWVDANRRRAAVGGPALNRRPAIPSARPLLSAAVMMCLLFADAGAQQSVDKPPPQITRQQAAAYLLKEKIITPGVGFDDARLGDRMSAIRDRWGKPLAERTTGVLRKRLEYLYQPDPNTQIIFIGRQRLQEIQVQGTAVSLLRTVRGARFSMQRNIIKQIYFHPPKKQTAERMTYPEHGVDFYFVNHQLTQLVIYPRKS